MSTMVRVFDGTAGDNLVARATCSVKPMLLGSPLGDVLLVDCSLPLLLLNVWGFLFRTRATPHFTEQPGDIRVGHVGILLLDNAASCLRVLEKRAHWALGG
jgi:hypothetical protein